MPQRARAACRGRGSSKSNSKNNSSNRQWLQPEKCLHGEHSKGWTHGAESNFSQQLPSISL
eukprot:scaffold116559_cov12-Tisochrysis_lutea.AAC.1